MPQVRERRFRVFDRKLAPRFAPFEKVERIEVDVVQDVQEVGVGLDEYLFGLALEQLSFPSVSFVEIIRVSDVEFAQERAESSLAPLRKEQVIVIAHNDPAVDVHQQLPFPIAQ